LWWELVETFPSSSTKEPHSGLSKQYEVVEEARPQTKRRHTTDAKNNLDRTMQRYKLRVVKRCHIPQ